MSKYFFSTVWIVMRSISFEDTAVLGLVAMVMKHGVPLIMEANSIASFMAKSCRTSENHMVVCPTSESKSIKLGQRVPRDPCLTLGPSLSAGVG